MIKIWGRNTSSNVQKAMWAVGELKLEHQRIDIGGAFGKNKEPAYLAMNPNGLVPTLEEEDGFLLWESNSIVRYLAGKHDKNGALEPKDPKQRALASQWMDWQLSVVGPAIFHAILGPDPYAAGKARHGSDQDLAGENHRRDENARRATGQDPICRGSRHFRTATFRSASCAIASCSWCRERPPMPNLDRWYGADLQTQGVPGSRRQRSAVVSPMRQ